MDPVWSRIVAAASNWVVSSIQIAYPTHFLVQNLENPQIWPGSEIPKCWKFLKIMKKTNFKLVRESFLHISCACWELCNTSKHDFSYWFRSLTSNPVPPSCDQDTKNDEKLQKTLKNRIFQICLEILHIPGAFCELATSKKMFFACEFLPPSHRIWNRGPYRSRYSWM